MIEHEKDTRALAQRGDEGPAPEPIRVTPEHARRAAPPAFAAASVPTQRRPLLDAPAERRIGRAVRSARAAMARSLAVAPASGPMLLDAWADARARRRLASEVLVNPLGVREGGVQPSIDRLRAALVAAGSGPGGAGAGHALSGNAADGVADALAALEPAYPMLQAMLKAMLVDAGGGAEVAFEPLLEAAVREARAAERRYLAARDALVESNVGLVWTVALRHREHGVEFDDVLQEGMTGLMRAVDKFDPSLGHRFSTFAMHWIRRAVTKALAEQSRTVRIPEHVHDEALALGRTRARLAQALGREPRAHEVAAATGDSPSRIVRTLAAVRSAVRLDGPSSAGASDVLVDLLPAPDGTDPARAHALNDARRRLERGLAALPERDAMALRLRYGLDGGGALATYEAVGRAMGLSREGARLAEARALRALRSRLVGGGS